MQVARGDIGGNSSVLDIVIVINYLVLVSSSLQILEIDLLSSTAECAAFRNSLEFMTSLFFQIFDEAESGELEKTKSQIRRYKRYF